MAVCADGRFEELTVTISSPSESLLPFEALRLQVGNGNKTGRALRGIVDYGVAMAEFHVASGGAPFVRLHLRGDSHYAMDFRLGTGARSRHASGMRRPSDLTAGTMTRSACFQQQVSTG